MRTTTIGLTVLSMTLWMVGAFAGETAEDMKAIQGTWSVIYAVFDGKQVPDAQIKKAEMMISAEKIIGREKGAKGWREIPSDGTRRD